MNLTSQKIIVECLAELSDRARQQELWMSAGPPGVSSFIECVEQLFTDSGLDGELHAGRTGFGRDVEAILCELEKRLSQVNSRRTSAEVINDPAMIPIRELAASALANIRGPMNPSKN